LKTRSKEKNSTATRLNTHLRLIFTESSESEFGLLAAIPTLTFDFLGFTLIKGTCDQTDRATAKEHQNQKAHRRLEPKDSWTFEAKVVRFSSIPAKSDILAACAKAAPAAKSLQFNTYELLQKERRGSKQERDSPQSAPCGTSSS
jgi:hypothetical protein